MRKFWLTPVFFASALFGTAAIAQEAQLPDAPSAQFQVAVSPQFQFAVSPQWQVKPEAKLDLSPYAPNLMPQKDDYNNYRLPPLPKEFEDKPGGIVGRSIEFFDSHSPKGETMFDFAMETRLGHGFSLIGGTVDMNNNTGHNGAVRQTVRGMTGLPDSETRDLRRAMSGGQPQQLNRGGGDGVAVGIRFHIGGGK